MTPRIPLPASLQGGPFTLATGADAGLSLARMRGPDLVTPTRGVRIPADSPLDLRTHCRAIQLRLPGAHFCGPTAALLHGSPLPLELERSRIVHVAVPAGRRAPTGRYIRGHAVRFEVGEVDARHGVRASTPARAWCELGAMLELADLVAVGDHLIHHRSPLASRLELADAIIGFPGRRGVRRLGEALPLLSDRAESRRESRVRVLLMQDGVTGFRVNFWITTRRGKRYRADIAFPDQKLALEYQGGHHQDPEQWRKDVTRRAELEADGWMVMEIAADDVGPELADLVRARLSAGRPHG